MATEHIREQQRFLHAHRTFLRAGLALVSAFAWVFVFQFSLAYSLSVPRALLFALVVYALSQVTLILITPLSAAHLRHGMKRAMFFGALCCALAFAVLGATLAGYFSSPLGWGLVLFGILLGVYHALYWIPYRLQNAGSSREPDALFEILLALMPAFAGVTLASIYLSPLRLLFGAAGLMLLSVVPLFFLRDSGERFSWRYFETFKKLFDVKYRTLTIRSTLIGVESAVLLLLWPLAVFMIVGRSYLVFGFVMSASVLILLAARGLYRKLLRSGPLTNSLALDVAFAMSGWILRLAAGSPLTIVFADAYSYVSTPAKSPEIVAREQRSDAGSYIDEFTALQEIGIAFGRILMCALVAVLLFTAPPPVALALSLILAALAAGAAAALSHRIRIEAY